MKVVKAGLLAQLAALWFAHGALACGVCIEQPEKPLSDLILGADAVVLAREDTARPYHFGVTTVLFGSVEDDAPIPFLVDSLTKRRLKANPADGVLLLQDGPSWIRVGYADAEVRKIATEILNRGPGWRTAPGTRFGFFNALLHDANPYMRHLAVDELSRAPYDLIRRMERPTGGARARNALADKAQFPWLRFHILMLGLSDNPEDHALIRDKLAVETRLGGGPHLEAWATAYVEIGGADAVTDLVRVWFETPQRKPEAVRAVIAALATQARYGDATLKRPIVAEFANLAQRRPDVVGSVAAALGKIGDFSHGDLIQMAVTNTYAGNSKQVDAAELFAASVYVHQSRSGNSGAPQDFRKMK